MSASDSSLEKHGLQAQHVDEAVQPKSPPEGLDDDPVYSYAEQRKIIHRVDRRLIVITGVMYCVSLMDRTNLSNARIARMGEDLDLSGTNYNVIALVFFITYVIFQPPMTIVCRKIGPRWFLSSITVLWGILMICFGFPNQWWVLIPLRMLLGVLEAGFFPGCVYLISTWYSRYDTAKRYSVFFMIGCLASAFSGILAFGLMQMEGVNGWLGWRWIFIWEGVLTVGVGIAGFFFLVEFPDRAAKTHKRFLNEEECNFIIRRINKDRGDVDLEEFSFKKWVSSGTDLKIWGFALIFFSVTTVAYSISFFLPIILVDNMGFSIGEAQCLVAPPYAFAGVVMYAGAWASDKWRLRGPVLAFNSLMCLTGLPIMAFGGSAGVRYFGTFLVTAGCNANVPATMTYQANNIRGQWKRAFCSATLVGFGGIGGIAGSLVFRQQDNPHYRPGIYACMACNGLVLVIVAVNTVYFRIQNRKADKEGKILEESPEFRYTI